MSDHIQFNGNIDLQSNNLDNLNNINGESGVAISLSPAAGQNINASSPIIGLMAGTNTSQIATKAYVDSTNLAINIFPQSIGSIQLGAPGAPIAPSATHTYTIPLGGTYTEIALSNFGWVATNSNIQTEPGVELGRISLIQQPEGGVLIATTVSGGWHRGFTMAYPEYQDGSGTPVTQVMFANSSQITNPLGYGTQANQTPLNASQLLTVPPGKVEISDVYISGTNLMVTIKNVDSVSFTLTGSNFTNWLAFARP